MRFTSFQLVKNFLEYCKAKHEYQFRYVMLACDIHKILGRFLNIFPQYFTIKNTLC